MDITGLLYHSHIQQTSLQNPPFSYSLPFNHELVNKEKYKSLKTDDNLDNFVKECYTKFRERNPNHILGTLDYNPKTWTKFGLKSIVDVYKSKTDKIIFPNGCCNLEKKCPINKFYEIVIEEICLE